MPTRKRGHGATPFFAHRVRIWRLLSAWDIPANFPFVVYGPFSSSTRNLYPETNVPLATKILFATPLSPNFFPFTRCTRTTVVPSESRTDLNCERKCARARRIVDTRGLRERYSSRMLVGKRRRVMISSTVIIIRNNG